MPTRPTRLVIVGARGQLGSWLGSNLFSRHGSWESVTLIDRTGLDQGEDTAAEFPDWPARGLAPAYFSVGDDQNPPDELMAAISAPNTALCISVGSSDLEAVARRYIPLVHPTSVVFDMLSVKMPFFNLMTALRRDLNFFGVHPLFAPTYRSIAGRRFVVCPQAGADNHLWLIDDIEEAGGIVKLLTPEKHDEIMSVVQTATHQALLLLLDVAEMSGLDLVDDLWDCRTPVFEAMLGLACRTVAPNQEATTSSIQLGTNGLGKVIEFKEAQRRLRKALDGGAPVLAKHINELRQPFPGTFFDTVRNSGNVVTTSTGTPMAALANALDTGELVGVRHAPGAPVVHVGKVEKLTSERVFLRALMVGPQGRAVVLRGAGVANARKLGVSGQSKLVKLGRNVEILDKDELEALLEEQLARLSIDLRLLVPESVSGEGMVAALAGIPETSSVSVLSETVLTGQREVVVRVWFRSDRDRSEVESAVRAHVDRVYQWPRGVIAKSAVDAGHRPSMGYLGPSGTFSHAAAVRLEALLATGGADVTGAMVPHESFDSLLSSLLGGELDYAVLPIVNSSSGLVDRAAAALQSLPATPRAVGMIDVPVRFAALAQAGHGAFRRVVSHPQGLLQCSLYIRRNKLEPVEASSTAAACEIAASDPECVALADPQLAAAGGLMVVHNDVGDLAGVVTRFLVFTRSEGTGEPADANSTWRYLYLVGSESPVERPDSSYMEVVAGAEGLSMLISSAELSFPEGARYLGRVPWAPRTPVTRVST